MTAKESLLRFLEADDVEDISGAFVALRAALGLGEEGELRVEQLRAAACSPGSPLNYRQQQLFGQLCQERVRQGNAEYCGRRVVVSGAGPCGLWAAVQARLNGDDVHVVEQRRRFSRHNIIKTWRESTIRALVALGLKSFVPSFRLHGNCHLGIRQAQMVLFKAALMLGVRFSYASRSCGIFGQSLVVVPAESEARASSLSLKPSPMGVAQMQQGTKVNFTQEAQSESGAILDAPPDGATCLPFDAFILAEGAHSWMLRNLGFKRKVRRFSLALGVVVNVRMSAASSSRAAFVASRAQADWRDTPLGPLEEQHQLGLENIEYMQGTDTHFIVVTVPKETLASHGVLRSLEPARERLVKRENVDDEKLRSFGRILADALGLEGEPFSEHHPVQLFDFSSAAKCTTTHRRVGKTGVVYPVGDALMSPFWPQGLGLNRGFHLAADAVFAAHQPSLEEAIREREATFVVCDWMVFKRSSLLPADQWTLDPCSRYSRNVFKSIVMHEKRHKVTQSALTDRMKRALEL